MRRVVAVLVVGVTLAIHPGCTPEDGESDADGAAALEAAIDDAELVAILEVTGERNISPALDPPLTDSSATVVEVLKGSAGPEVIVQQVGDFLENSRVPEGEPIIEGDEPLLLFLERSAESRSGNIYRIVNGGHYRSDGDEARRVSSGNGLPSRIDLDDLRKTLESA